MGPWEGLEEGRVEINESREMGKQEGLQDTR
jgi:hypothetical protein